MSNRHNHTTPRARRRRQPNGNLPANKFGVLVGKLDHWTFSPHDGNRPDDNHIYLWIRSEGEPNGVYEVAVNVRSSNRLRPGEDPSVLDLRYALISFADEDGLPNQGFFSAEVSYSGMELTENDFTPVRSGELRELVKDYAETCEMIEVYGVTYGRGDGLHEVHMNSGNRPPREDENRVNQDGAVVFYFTESDGLFARWLFLKFYTQDFPA